MNSIASTSWLTTKISAIDSRFMSISKKIELVKISDLKPYKNNARTHSTRQVEQIAASIAEFGFTNPLLVDPSNVVIAGHGRLEAAKLLGMKEVPVIVLSHLSEKQVKALVLADNRIAEDARWDYDLLKSELILLEELDFDVSNLGFSEHELEMFLKVDPSNPDSLKEEAPRKKPETTPAKVDDDDAVEAVDVNSADEHWVGMPEFNQEDKAPYRTIHVHFASELHVKMFADLVKQTITDRTRYLWYPFIEIEQYADKRWIGEKPE